MLDQPKTFLLQCSMSLMPFSRTGLQNFSVIREIDFQSNQTRLCPRQLANLLPFLGWHISVLHIERNKSDFVTFPKTWENQRYFSPMHIGLGQSNPKVGSTYKHKLLDTWWSQSQLVVLESQDKMCISTNCLFLRVCMTQPFVDLVEKVLASQMELFDNIS